jgi:hypothetical protein
LSSTTFIVDLGVVQANSFNAYFTNALLVFIQDSHQAGLKKLGLCIDGRADVGSLSMNGSPTLQQGQHYLMQQLSPTTKFAVCDEDRMTIPTTNHYE